MGEKRPEKETILKQSAERILRYFDIFSYPLRAEEVWAFCLNVQCTPSEINVALQSLLSENKIQSHTSENAANTDNTIFYGINDPMLQQDVATSQKLPHPPVQDSLPERIQKRHVYNQRADSLLPLAYRMGRLIGAFPFVRGVFVSGSLSKHAMKSDSDIDFFIITHPGRLWITRTMLVCFKKIFLFNSHKYFCVNYFVDTLHLEIEDKNLFTAMETVTLLPVYGGEWYSEFCTKNSWAWLVFPNMPYRTTDKVPPHKRSLIKGLLEYLFSGHWAARLDQFLLRLTIKFWRRKFKDYDPEAFEQAFRSEPHISKHHPQHFQRQVLNALSSPDKKEK